MENKTISKIDLAQFTGSEKYYQYHNMLLTDGAYYLAEKAGCFWLMDVIWSHNIENRWFEKEALLANSPSKILLEMLFSTMGTVMFYPTNTYRLPTSP